MDRNLLRSGGSNRWLGAYYLFMQDLRSVPETAGDALPLWNRGYCGHAKSREWITGRMVIMST
jgi:hypothetical protein